MSGARPQDRCDLGLAFAVVLVLIYVLVVGWLQSFTIPLVIMAPIPLTLVGIGFQGRAVSLMSGAVVATLLTMVLVPLLYGELRRGRTSARGASPPDVA